MRLHPLRRRQLHQRQDQAQVKALRRLNGCISKVGQSRRHCRMWLESMDLRGKGSGGATVFSVWMFAKSGKEWKL